MLLTIILLLLFLIGVSLLVSVLATAFLKRHARPLGGSTPRRIVRGTQEAEGKDYSQEYRRAYADAVESIASEEVRTPQRQPVVPQPVRPSVGRGRWAWIIVTVIVVGIVSSYFGVKSYKVWSIKPRLYLCEGVDFVRLKPIHASDTFTRGNVTLFYTSKYPLNMKHVQVVIQKVGPNGFMPYARKKINLKPEWTSFVFKTLFDSIGTYLVEIYDEHDNLLVKQFVHIVGDEYAYKAVKKPS